MYKEAKLLRVAVGNAEKIDRALEGILNVTFYSILACIVLSIFGIDPIALFLSLSSITVALAFMSKYLPCYSIKNNLYLFNFSHQFLSHFPVLAVGTASSKMFEGWLFILLRRPYDIGDRIHVSSPESEASPNGSATWYVRDVDLFSTTVVYATTGEKATLSNGSLANSRIINFARSPNAILYVSLKLSTNVPHERIQILELAVRQFVKDRPREWRKFHAMRPTLIASEHGFVGTFSFACHQHCLFRSDFTHWHALPHIRIFHCLGTPRGVAKYRRHFGQQSQGKFVVLGATKETGHSIHQSTVAGRSKSESTE